MSDLPVTCLARHDETAWSLTGQHTGRTDLQRAARTCGLAGFDAVSEGDCDLLVERAKLIQSTLAAASAGGPEPGKQ